MMMISKLLVNHPTQGTNPRWNRIDREDDRTHPFIYIDLLYSMDDPRLGTFSAGQYHRIIGRKGITIKGAFKSPLASTIGRLSRYCCCKKSQGEEDKFGESHPRILLLGDDEAIDPQWAK